LVAAAAVLASSSAVTQVGVIAAGGAVGWLLYRRELPAASVVRAGGAEGRPLLAAGALVVFLALLVALPLAASASGQRLVAEFDSFYRSGALVFGGGHVVLPLLRAEVVPSGWLSDEQFLAGYGAAQALPGPLFTFAAYLGAAMSPAHPWLNGWWCLLGIFLPAWLLIGGALPFWHRLRGQPWAQGALAGANAAVVGVLLAALYRPVIAESIQSARDVVAALLAFGLLQVWKVPAWAVVALLAAAGQWLR
jgi:chromate transporter